LATVTAILLAKDIKNRIKTRNHPSSASALFNANDNKHHNIEPILLDDVAITHTHTHTHTQIYIQDEILFSLCYRHDGSISLIIGISFCTNR
jgi:hypothetical protein